MFCYNISKMRTQTMIPFTMAKLTARYVKKSFNRMSYGENTSNCYIIRSTKLRAHFVIECLATHENCMITNDITMKRRRIVLFVRNGSLTHTGYKVHLKFVLKFIDISIYPLYNSSHGFAQK